MNKYIFKRQQWKSGIVLQIGNSCTEIIEYFNYKKLKIRIAGQDRLEALAVLRNKINELHDTFENLLSHEMVPCNCNECQKRDDPFFFDYDEIKQYKNEGEEFIKCRIGKIKNVNVQSLIGDVFVKEDSDKLERILQKEGITLNINQNIGQTNIQKQEVKQKSSQVVDININIKVDLPAIQDDFVNLKEILITANPNLEKGLDKIEDSLDCVTPESNKKELAKPMNKMRRFLEKVKDENSDLHKAIKGAKKGIEIAQKIGKTYNKFAQWLALPQVPDLFLGN